jgi:hypothetical protein
MYLNAILFAKYNYYYHQAKRMRSAELATHRGEEE